MLVVFAYPSLRVQTERLLLEKSVTHLEAYLELQVKKQRFKDSDSEKGILFPLHNIILKAIITFSYLCVN